MKGAPSASHARPSGGGRGSLRLMFYPGLGLAVFLALTRMLGMVQDAATDAAEAGLRAQRLERRALMAAADGFEAP